MSAAGQRLMEDALDALCDALPFIEGAPDNAYKPGFVASRRNQTRRVIERLMASLEQPQAMRDKLKDQISNGQDV